MAHAATRKGAKERRRCFAEEYVIDLCATQAAIRAGFSPKSAGQTGYELLKHPEVQAIIAAKQRQRSHDTGITMNRVIEEIGRLAFSDLRRLFDTAGQLKKLTDLDDATAASLASVEVVTTGGGDDEVLYVKKFRSWDKNAALEKLLKHLQGVLPEPNHAPSLNVTVKLDFEAIRARRAQVG